MEVYCDGSMSAICYIVVYPTNTETKHTGRTRYKEPHRAATHNIAEYDAIIMALEEVDSDNFTIVSDSQLVMYQIKGHYHTNCPVLRARRDMVRALARGRHILYHWVPRERNLAGIYIDRQKGRRIDK